MVHRVLLSFAALAVLLASSCYASDPTINNWWGVAETNLTITAVSIEPDFPGDPYVVGSLYGVSSIGTAIGVSDFFVAKYEARYGTRLWWRPAGGVGCAASGLSITWETSSWVITGKYANCATFQLWDGTLFPAAGATANGFILRVGVNGTLQHYRTFSGGFITAVATGISPFFVAGTFSSAMFSDFNLNKSGSLPNGFYARLNPSTFETVGTSQKLYSSGAVGTAGIVIKELNWATSTDMVAGDRLYLAGEADTTNIVNAADGVSTSTDTSGYSSTWALKVKTTTGALVGGAGGWIHIHSQSNCQTPFAGASWLPVTSGPDYQTMLISNDPVINKFFQWEVYPETIGASPNTYTPSSGTDLWYTDSEYSTSTGEHFVLGHCDTSFTISDTYLKKGNRDVVLVWDAGDFAAKAWNWGVAGTSMEGTSFKIHGTKLVMAGLYTGSNVLFYTGGPTIPAATNQPFLAFYDLADTARPSPAPLAPIDPPLPPTPPVEPPVDAPVAPPVEPPVAQPVAPPVIVCEIPEGVTGGYCTPDGYYIPNNVTIDTGSVEISIPVIIGGDLTIGPGTNITFTNSTVSVIVAGCVTINGGTLQLLPDPSRNGQSQTVISSTGGCLTGQFGDIEVITKDQCETATVTPTYSSSDLSVLVSFSDSQTVECGGNIVDPDGLPVGGIAGIIIGAVAVVAVGVAVLVVVLRRRSLALYNRSIRPVSDRSGTTM